MISLETCISVKKFFPNNKDDKSPVQLTGKLEFGKYKSSEHGFHIHQFGDLSEGISTLTRHVGDFGNISVNSQGVADIKMTLPENVTLVGDKSIIGRALVVHAKKDDLGQGGDEESKKTGNAGPRIACAVIGIADCSKVSCD